jgi:NAD(P)-dependent dehydrogenase (short-subunit alcohol dehydrogenase family)
MFDFNNKKVVITGGSGGIGKVVTQKFLERGADVVLFDLDANALNAVKRSFTQGNVEVVQGDVTNREDLNRLTQTAGKIDVLVCLIGLFIPSPFEQTDDDTIDKMLTINVKSTILTIQAALPVMQEFGSIVTLSSSAHLKPLPMGGALYSASKAAVKGLSRSLALELMPQKIRVNTVCPGPIDTERMAAPMVVSNEIKEQIAETIPMKHLGKPEDVANAILYLSSDEASFITGEEFVIDGGLTSL